MYERTSRRTVIANPLSFFAVSNLPMIRGTETRSQPMTLDQIEEEVSSAHSGITALPRWESVKNPRRAHIRNGSQDPVLEKSAFAKETALGLLGSRSGASTPADKENPRHSRMMVWLVLVVVTVLILAIVLGAVLGTFVNPGSHSSTPQPSVTEIPAGSTPTPTGDGGSPTPTSTPHIVSLAVAGYSVPGILGYFIVWLFYQDTQGYLSRATFNSSTGSWTRVSSFTAAKQGTPLAATIFSTEYYAGQPNYSFPHIQYQAEIVYLDDRNYLNEWIFPDSGPEIGQPGLLNQQKYMAHEDSKIAFYWPQLVYQGMSGEIRRAHFECHRKDECWHETVLGTSAASNGTQLTTVPLRNNLSSTGLFYKEEGGRYVSYKEDNGQPSAVWTNEAFSDLIPSSSSVTAFSTTRSSNVGDSMLNTYLLWQDTNGTIQMSWSDTDSGWKGPMFHPVFADADNDTALACLTGLTFPGFPLPAGTELSRCYFQAGDGVREVSFDGTGWDVVGSVPIEF